MVTVRLFHLATRKITIRTIKDNSNSDSQEKVRRRPRGN